MPETLDDDSVQQAIRKMFLDGTSPGPPISAHELRTKEGRSRLRIGVKAPVAVAAVVLLVVVLFTATPLRHRGESTSKLSSSHPGWAAHSAYGIQISVPESWKVSYFPVCPNGAGLGQLSIGASETPGACAAEGQNSIVVIKVPAGSPALSRSSLRDFKRITVNGLNVLASSSDFTTQWYVDSERISIYANGPDTARMLATLSRSTLKAIPAPGIGNGSAHLVALSQIPISGPVQVRSVATGKRVTVRSNTGNFTFEGAPGRYVVTTSDGNAPCAPINVSLISGTYSTWPPLVCRGE
jgi:hypothetical protein